MPTTEPLILERRTQQDESGLTPSIAITPPIREDYWAYRVRLNDTGQAIIGFPKFFTVGIGFAQEDDDWNTNLPYTCSTDEIWQHIAHNRGDDSISEESVRLAIAMVKDAIREDLSAEDTR